MGPPKTATAPAKERRKQMSKNFDFNYTDLDAARSFILRYTRKLGVLLFNATESMKIATLMLRVAFIRP